MVWSTFTPEQMHAAGQQVFLPLALMVNYSLLLYIFLFYRVRYREWRVSFLFAVAFTGVVCQIPFASDDQEMVMRLNDASESSGMLVFLLQITIMGYDMNKKMKFKSVIILTYIAEALIVFAFITMLISLILVVDPTAVPVHVHEHLPNISETASVVFIFVFRFYFIIRTKGVMELVRNRKAEVVCYFLFATHEMIFETLNYASGLSWEYGQVLFHRLTLFGCLCITASSKLRASTKSGAMSKIPSSIPPPLSSGPTGNKIAAARSAGPTVDRVGSRK